MSRYLDEVRQGEELLIRDLRTPIAKIVPVAQSGELNAEELGLAAEGKLRLPEPPLPPPFWSLPAPRVALKRVAAAVRVERDE